MSIGQRAQTVVEHPGFQMFLDHLEEVRTMTQRERDSLAQQALQGTSLGAELDKLKLQIVSLDGQLKGLGQAIDLIPELIKRATQASSVVTTS